MIKNKKLLLHACCGPCFIYPHSELMRIDNLSVSIYYYNPNIHPLMEYVRRLETLADYCAQSECRRILGEYNPSVYLRAVAGNEDARCRICYKIRLEETARYASKNDFDTFSTTLTVSPYQDHDMITAIGNEAAEKYGIEFTYVDYRNGFREAQNTARDIGMYRQGYCGCIYSEHERYAKKYAKTIEQIESRFKQDS